LLWTTGLAEPSLSESGNVKAATIFNLAICRVYPQWRIPAAKMKMKEQRIVPLSAQAVAVFEKVILRRDQAAYVFRCNAEDF